MPLSAGTRLGPYEITAQIGVGGMGEVYRARDTKLNRDVAIKVLPDLFANDPERLARFGREAQTLAALNHPNIAHIYGLDESGGVRALVMELVEGEDLSRRIALGPMPIVEALPIARQIAEALEAAHEQGIIHRDLKPANIKLRSDGRVKVLDFGLAKALDTASASATNLSQSATITAPAVTLMGVVLGTPAYMSPEQATGKHVDRRADIWAFGIVFFEMLMGHAAYPGGTAAEILASVRAEAPDLRGLSANSPQSICTLIGRCLDQDPRSRLRDIGEARIAIDRALGRDVVDQTNRPSATARTSSRLAWSLAAVLGLAAGGLALTHFGEHEPDSAILRFQVLPPEKTTVDGVAISPDGRTLAFTATDLSRTSHLWLRPLDSAVARLVAGTEAASYAFWSPDGRQIAFFAEGKLKKTTLSGEPPQTLCEAAYGRGGSWSRRGFIIFGPSTSSALWRVSENGGKKEPLTVLDESRQETAHYWPAFLPDADHFLLTVRSARRENSGIYVGSTGSEARTRLLGDMSNASVVTTPDGKAYLLFARGETLMAQRFDLGTLHLSGELQPVADHVGNSVNFSLASYSVSDGALVYTSNSASPETLLTLFDRSGNRIRAIGESGLYARLQLSPNETEVVIDRMDPRTSEWDVWLIDSKRDVSSRFTLDPKDEMFPVLSPDGKRVAFASNHAGVFDLYEKEIGGAGGETLLLKSDTSKYPTDWSSDGRFLLYREDDPSTRLDVWILPLPTTAPDATPKPIPFLISPANEWDAVFSPDGNWVAYVSDESNKPEVYVRRFLDSGSGGNRKWQVSAGGGSKPRWPRIGNEIFYSSAARKIMAVDVRMGSVLEMQAPKPLFALPETPDYVDYGVTSDGKQFLVPTPTHDMTSSPATVVVNWIAGLKK